MTCGENLQEEQKYNFIPWKTMKTTKSHYDLGILEVAENRHTTISEWCLSALRLMGSMTLLREGGSYPIPKS